MSKENFEIFESALLREKYYRYTHACGLPVYVFPKKLSTAYAIFATRYGSIDNVFSTNGGKTFTEVPDGIAHFLEHKLFANEDGSDAFEHFSAIGADANAYTSFNKTAYLFSCTQNFPEALGELIDFVTHPYFTDASVKKECGIIAQEIKMYDDHPSESCYYGMLDGLYEHHSVKRNICGSVESINRITPELLYGCYRAFYDMSNMVLIVCGDVTPDEIAEIADAHLPKQMTTVSVIRDTSVFEEKPAVHRARVTKQMKVAKPIFNIGIKDTDIPSDPYERLKKDAAMSILSEILFCRAGKLYSELFESEIISPDISYGYTMSETFAFTSLAGEASDPEAVLSKTRAYIEALLKNGIEAADFERAKRVMYAEFVKEFDSTEIIANNLLAFIFESANLFEYASIISSVTLDTVSELLASRFKEEFFTMSCVFPLDKEQ